MCLPQGDDGPKLPKGPAPSADLELLLWSSQQEEDDEEYFVTQGQQ